MFTGHSPSNSIKKIHAVSYVIDQSKAKGKLLGKTQIFKILFLTDLFAYNHSKNPAINEEKTEYIQCKFGPVDEIIFKLISESAIIQDKKGPEP
ncbi:hypothetical protein DSECCO2_92460 [anaerobic digester metagenome]